MLTRGYNFYFDDGELMVFPITPSELTISSGSRNETIDLINEGEINILKSPSLIEVSFEARFPMREYPYSRVPEEFQRYFNKFADLKTNKKPFRFIVSRVEGATRSPYETNLLVALEDFETKESADEGDDIICSFKLKQYKSYGVKHLATAAAPTTTVKKETRDSSNKSATSTNYTVKSGDCLWNIAKAAYGDGSKWRVIYDANKTIIENAAKKHGRQSSQDGHWIYPNTVLVIPSVSAANLTVEKLAGSKSTASTGTTGSKSSPNLTPAKSNTAVNNTKHKVTISCNGINAYAGTYEIIYIKDKVQKLSKVLNPSTTTIYVDHGTSVTVTLKMKQVKNLSGKWDFHDATVTTFVGDWTKRTKGATQQGYIHYVYSAVIKYDSGFNIKWVE